MFMFKTTVALKERIRDLEKQLEYANKMNEVERERAILEFKKEHMKVLTESDLRRVKAETELAAYKASTPDMRTAVELITKVVTNLPKIELVK